MRIKDLKEDHLLIYEAAVSQLDEGANDSMNLGNVIAWQTTREGYDFWYYVSIGNFDKAYEICPRLKINSKFNDEMGNPILKPQSKPPQYQIGIDTFERMKANCTKEEIIGFCKGNVDKYIHRKKGTDKEDLVKAKDYIDLWLWALENK